MTWSNLPTNSRRDAANGRPAPRPGRKDLPTADEMERSRYDECPGCRNGQGWLTHPLGAIIACNLCHPRSVHHVHSATCGHHFIVSPVPDNPDDAYF